MTDRDAAVEHAAEVLANHVYEPEILECSCNEENLSLPGYQKHLAQALAYADLLVPGDAATEVEWGVRWSDGTVAHPGYFHDARSAREYAALRDEAVAVVSREVTRIEGPWEVVDDA
jgi:hypothetical protein